MEISAEELRILRAARDGRIRSSGHWIIDGESRPERPALERVKQHGWVIDALGGGGWRYELTPDGRAALAEAEAEAAAPDG
ncbi:hypothetical protein [Conexibacter woesei]|uniref:Uncharacterized protein n=1 Tax=Conexibacter woesei (strain DSM 14684 / CCUG 47730 / CIP 108061 / JCM 11494 / NBRC 100937 / ID131577) TaxID=469383 RepID=D3F5S4_CONWI|nr:hypothetical protein [Conexibacter woesei]ADB52623.1 hypothetical protein Cwoe_4209 [Conexibacter woesei DSM 14684]